MKELSGKYLKYIILVLAVGALVFGIYRGDMEGVLRKAAAICMECIGIG